MVWVQFLPPFFFNIEIVWSFLYHIGSQNESRTSEESGESCHFQSDCNLQQYMGFYLNTINFSCKQPNVITRQLYL